MYRAWFSLGLVVDKSGSDQSIVSIKCLRRNRRSAHGMLYTSAILYPNRELFNIFWSYGRNEQSCGHDPAMQGVVSTPLSASSAQLAHYLGSCRKGR
jgi:hypothetical protein